MVDGLDGRRARSVAISSATIPQSRLPSMTVSPPANNPRTVDGHHRRGTGAPRGPPSPGGRRSSFTTVVQGALPLSWGGHNQAKRSPLLAVHPVPAAAIHPAVLRRPKRRGTDAARGRHRPRTAWRAHRVQTVCGNGCLAVMASGVPAAVSSTAAAARVARRRLPRGHRAGRSQRPWRRVGRRERLRQVGIYMDAIPPPPWQAMARRTRGRCALRARWGGRGTNACMSSIDWTNKRTPIAF